MKYLWFLNEHSSIIEGNVNYINIKLPRKGRTSKEMFSLLGEAFKMKVSIKLPLMVIKLLLIILSYTADQISVVVNLLRSSAHSE